MANKWLELINFSSSNYQFSKIGLLKNKRSVGESYYAKNNIAINVLIIANTTPKTIVMIPKTASFFRIAIIPKIIASGPKTIGKTTKDNTAKMSPKILYILPFGFFSAII